MKHFLSFFKGMSHSTEKTEVTGVVDQFQTIKLVNVWRSPRRTVWLPLFLRRKKLVYIFNLFYKPIWIITQLSYDSFHIREAATVINHIPLSREHPKQADSFALYSVARHHSDRNMLKYIFKKIFGFLGSNDLFKVILQLLSSSQFFNEYYFFLIILF